MSFALVEGKLDAAVASWLSLAQVKPLPARPLVGYSSWYRHYDRIDQELLLGDLASMYALLHGRDLRACVPLFQIDDGYTTVGDWMSPDMQRFPKGMRYMTRQIRAFGMMPGLWMAPFVCSADSRLYAEHPDWLLRDETGAPVSTGSHWNGAYALDTLHPQVREYVRRSLWGATHDWGFRMLKLDFLYAACMLPHGGMNRAELMADALGLLRASVPEDVVFDLCGVPLTSAFGRTEYCRIGCDVGLDWDDLPWMRLLHRERVSTKRSLANTRGRAHLDGRAFRNDPDVFFLRDDVRLTDEQRSRLLEADATLGGVFFTSDDMGLWSDDQRAAFEAALARFVARADKE
jgi:alpha-galactosidase